MSKNPRKEQIMAAMKGYSDKIAKERAPKKSRARNKHPEKDVETECLVLMRSWGWSVSIFEAKAVWNASANAWVQSGMKAGTCDCLGSDDHGVAVAVEFKAPGKLSSFNRPENFRQREFIVDKINANCFACVVDSASHLEVIYTRWLDIKNSSKDGAKAYLISALPIVSEKTSLKDKKLFDDE